MIEQEEWVMIRNLYQQGVKKTEIGQMLGMDRKTVAKYVNRTSSPKYKTRPQKNSKLEPYYGYIKDKLDKYNLTSEKIYENIKTIGYTGGYGIVNKYVQSIKQERKIKAVLRFETMPGEQAQVDWGYFGRFYDQEKKKHIKLNCFFMILGYSRTLYIEFFERADLTNFLIGHNNAFRYFGGYTKEILYDNLKSVVIKRRLRIKDSEFNKKFMDFAGYYGFLPILCRPYKPSTKGKVENSVNYAKQNFFAGEEFISLQDINKRAKEWLKKINDRIHQSTKQKPTKRLERENLIPLDNKEIYDTRPIFYRRVFNDCHFSYEGNRYSVPYKYTCKEIIIKITKEILEIFYRNEKIAEHKIDKISKGIYITKEEHISDLKDIKKREIIYKPKKKNNKQISSCLINGASDYVIEVNNRDLKEYEEVEWIH